jgi:hypothetical protein
MIVNDNSNIFKVQTTDLLKYMTKWQVDEMSWHLFSNLNSQLQLRLVYSGKVGRQ